MKTSAEQNIGKGVIIYSDNHPQVMKYISETKAGTFSEYVSFKFENPSNLKNNNNFFEIKNKKIKFSYQVIDSSPDFIHCKPLKEILQETIQPVKYTPPTPVAVEEKKKKKPQFYETQVKVGHEIFTKLRALIDLSKFQSFEYKIVCPIPTSLRKQTKNRVIQAELDPTAVVSTIETKKREEFRLHAKNNPTTFYFVVQDECHWGIVEGGLLDRWINNPEFMKLENVAILHVSATPYNILSAHEKYKQQLINWPNTENYKGREFYIKSKEDLDIRSFQNICLDSEATPLVKHVFHSCVKGIEKIKFSECCIVIEYITSLQRVLSGKGNPKDSIDQLWTCLLYDQQRNFCVLRLSYDAACVLRDCVRKIFGENKRTFYLLLDYDKTELADELKEEHKYVSEKWKTMNDIQDGGYENLGIISCLLLIDKKGKMGDTFPDTLRFFDHHARNVGFYSSLIQDVGRCFGYRENPPKMIVTHETYDALCKNPTDIKDLDAYLKKQKIPEDAHDEAAIYELFPTAELQKHHMHHSSNGDLFNEAVKRRILLSAFPQCGKTGAFLYCIKLLQHHFKSNESFKDLASFYRKLNSYELEKLMRYEEYQNRFFRKKAAHNEKFGDVRDKISTILKAVISKSHLKNLKKITVADFGCGQQLEPKYFIVEGKEIDLYGCDFAIKQETDKAKRTNMQTSGFNENQFEIIVFCMSFGYGNRADRKKYLVEALRVVKEFGIVIIIDTEKVVEQAKKFSAIVGTKYKLINKMSKQITGASQFAAVFEKTIQDDDGYEF